VLMPSWNWSFSRKDMEVYGTGGYAITVGADRLRVRYRGEKTESQNAAAPLPKSESNALSYLAEVLRGHVTPDGDLSSLETNMVVMQILDAGRRSAQTGRTVAIAPLPK
jgi:glucose-fructose oxidoreductase